MRFEGVLHRSTPSVMRVVRQARERQNAAMPNVKISIEQIIDFSDCPGWVRCELRDAFGCIWKFEEKIPIVSAAELSLESTFPATGAIACIVVERLRDPDGRAIIAIDTERPDGVESVDGQSRFVVFAEQLTES